MRTKNDQARVDKGVGSRSTGSTASTHEVIRWDDVAEVVKMHGSRIAVTLFDGTTHEISADALSALVTGESVTVGAVDPHAGSTGTPTTRVKESS